jgi:hypothetical protein
MELLKNEPTSSNQLLMSSICSCIESSKIDASEYAYVIASSASTICLVSHRSVMLLDTRILIDYTIV